MNEPKVIIECEQTSCRYHDGLHNCKSERIEIKTKADGDDDCINVCNTAAW
jgi:hypothetical protein